jgi:outer membrane protein OmpA-like peptidoglycan-associated protein
MSRFDTYSVAAAEAPGLRRWLFFTLILSLALHAGLFAYFHFTRVEGFVFDEKNLTVAKPFNLKRVSIPEPPREEQQPPPAKTVPKMEKFTIPVDKPKLEEIHLAPQLNEIAKPVFTDKPMADGMAERLAKAEASTRQAMDKQLSSNLGDLLKDSSRVSRNQARVAIGTHTPTGGDLNIPGIKSVDDLLAHTGSFKNGEKAAMSGGALFSYDSATLVPQAIESLRKLGVLIQQNPNVTFSIEGHTDSFGSPQYNMGLSLRRANAVRDWLVANMGIAPSRIETKGFGDTKLIVPADKSQDEQAPNRRVEIVLKTHRR